MINISGHTAWEPYALFIFFLPLLVIDIACFRLSEPNIELNLRLIVERKLIEREYLKTGHFLSMNTFIPIIIIIVIGMLSGLVAYIKIDRF